MKILVTGGSGFIGSHIVEHYLSLGNEVKIVDDLSTGSPKNIEPFQTNPAFEFTQSNILQWKGIEEAVAWADLIYHMAAVVGIYRVINEPIQVLLTNIIGTEYLLQSMVKAGSKARILIASTSSVYGYSPKEFQNEDDNLIVTPYKQPLWGYAVSKIADEALAHAYFRKYKIPITPVRFFNTIGPRQTGLYGMVVPRFVQQACKGEPLTVFGDGNQVRSFCDVRDSVAAMHIIAEKNLSIGEPINVGMDKEISINKLAEITRRLANSNSEIKHVPYTDAYGVTFMDTVHRKPDISKLKNLTGFKHKWTLETTIEDLIKRQREGIPADLR